MGSGSAMATPDPILVRRARLTRLAGTGRRLGYLAYAIAAVAFFYGLFGSTFDAGVARVAVAGLVVGSVLLAPSIVAGYAIRAAEKADRDNSW